VKQAQRAPRHLLQEDFASHEESFQKVPKLRRENHATDDAEAVYTDL
jgi:hypothetical protein